MFIILQILTSVKEITLVTWMLYAWTPKDLMFVLVTPDILEMEATAQVLDVFLLKPFPSSFPSYSAAPFSRVARQLGNLLLITGFDLGSHFSC